MSLESEDASCDYDSLFGSFSGTLGAFGAPAGATLPIRWDQPLGVNTGRSAVCEFLNGAQTPVFDANAANFLRSQMQMRGQMQLGKPSEEEGWWQMVSTQIRLLFLSRGASFHPTVGVFPSMLCFRLSAVAAELQCVLKCASDLYTPCESAEA